MIKSVHALSTVFSCRILIHYLLEFSYDDLMWVVKIENTLINHNYIVHRKISFMFKINICKVYIYNFLKVNNIA